MPLEVCNLDAPFRRYHVCTEDWLTAGRTHSAGQEGNWLRSAFSRTDPAARPHRPSPGGNGPRSTENITSRPTPTADHIPCTVDPMSANKKPTYAVLTILSPINLNRLVKT
ncbi:unnamed protein product [Microthlaspi erraticum]|uniref:Uncharacterized protein n=1 Tax=Microthlaspi erraticum TaxID=1685480 RepID=A0A6D2IPP2_9BRAS|nr:unnamed protein product [Microthlaspi erraticum]